MSVRPTSIDELCDAVVSVSRLSVRGGGTKPALSIARPEGEVLDVSGLSGIVEHVPEECTFTALAGTRVADIERLLAPHGQYLPFDPLFVEAGATIGGTVASGVNGSCRYRYGGLRDFLIGARIVDGRGRVVRSGGKVVKNAAGFLIHEAMVGSCGRLGVLAEVTFKVFPAAQAHATVVADAVDVPSAVTLMRRALAGRFDLEAVDIDTPGTLLVRVAGAFEALPQRIQALRAALAADTEVREAGHDARVWHGARECAWAPVDHALVRVPITMPRIHDVERLVRDANIPRKYGLAGNVAWMAWPGDLGALSRGLADAGLVGQVLRGRSERPFIGHVPANDFERRVRQVMDPDGRFGEE